MNIFKSSRRIWMLMVLLTMCIWFITWKLESKDFMYIAALIVQFYYYSKLGEKVPSDPDLTNIKNL